MSWQQIVIVTSSNHAETFGEFFERNDALAVTYVDADDSPIYEPNPGELTFWPDTKVIGLFASTVDTRNVTTNLNCLGVSSDEYQFHVELLEDKEWTREWMDTFTPMQFGEKLWICPSWCSPPYPNAVNIMLDPGLAFGTGTHDTTSLCLQYLDSVDMRDKIVTDYGCGSGILAIAAAKLGASRVLAVDIDPQAIIATNDNADKNFVTDRVFAYLASEQPEIASDIVIANILSGPLKQLKPHLAKLCKTNGSLVLSGLLNEQAEELITFYSDLFHKFEIGRQGDWARIIAKKREQ